MCVCRGGSRPVATSKMELFLIIVNGFQPLTIITKCYILDVAAVLGAPLLRLCGRQCCSKVSAISHYWDLRWDLKSMGGCITCRTCRVYFEAYSMKVGLRWYMMVRNEKYFVIDFNVFIDFTSVSAWTVLAYGMSMLYLMEKRCIWILATSLSYHRSALPSD